MNKMKKNFLMFAALVAASLGFTACSSDDDLASAEQEARGVVKTEFTISIPQRTSGVTRMTTATVQGQMSGNAQNPVFRGIQDIFLYPLPGSATDLKTTAGASATNLPKAVTLFKGTSANGWDGPSSNTSNNMIDGTTSLNSSSSHLYKDVEIPIGTKSLMFYGEALRTTNTTDFQNGAIKKNLDESSIKLSDIRFWPHGIVTSNAVSNNGKNIADYMTKIAQATGWSSTNDVALATMYERFTSTRTGSWRNVKAIVQELYSNIYSRTTNGHTDETPNSVFAEADAIESAILNTSIGTTTTKFVTSHSGSTLTFVADATLGTYPEDMRLPDGAAQISWDNSNSDATKWQFNALTATENTGLNVAALTSYAYPAPLYYQVLSDIRVSESSKYAAYSTANNWDAVLAAYEKVSNTDQYYREVTSKTRSIAVDDQIQYAVGRLDLKVKASSFSMKDFDGNDVSAAGENFKLTGVFIDGQKEVDYQFHPVTYATTTDENNAVSYTVYDNDINGDIYLRSDEPTVMNHTLLLESKANQPINIALEFLNNSGKTIIGQNNCIIHPGCKFYLKGELNPDSKTIKNVFKQDYITNATLTVKSFENAYNILPDLRAPDLELGMSVNLTWQPGETYNINIE